jgi:hypothetical protein
VLQRSAGQDSNGAAAEKSKDNAKITLDVETGPPTSDQLRSILEFTGAAKASDIIEGAVDEADAQRRLRGSSDAFKRPLVQ